MNILNRHTGERKVGLANFILVLLVLIMADAKIQALEKQVADLKLLVSAQNAPITKVVTTGAKLKKYSGCLDTLEEWIGESKRILRQQGLEGQDGADHLILHLEGSAHDEVRGQVTDTPDAVYKILRAAFGEQCEVGELVGLFHSRGQKEGETLREFLHALVNLSERVKKLNANQFPDTDTALRDRFKEGVRDPLLSAWLKQRVRDYPNKKFRELLSEAIKYSADHNKTVPVKKTSRSTTKQEEMYCEAARADPIDRRINKLAERQQSLFNLVKEQQEQQKQLVELLKDKAERSNVQAARVTGRGGVAGKGQGQCYYCNKYGHYKKDCRAFKRFREQEREAVRSNWSGQSQPWSNQPQPVAEPVSVPQKTYPSTNVYTPQNTSSYPPVSSQQATGRQFQNGTNNAGSCRIGVESVPRPPDALVNCTVGTRPMELVSIAGVKVMALVDSGSQISSVSQSFYEEMLAPLGLELIDVGWIEVSAANGLGIPYLGLLVTDVVVDGYEVKGMGILVAKDMPETREGTERVPALLGMNILRDIPKFRHFAPKDQSYDYKAGYVRVAGAKTVILPPFSVSEIEVLTPRCSPTFFVEPLSEMIRGVAKITPGLVEARGEKVNVRVANFSEVSVEIPPRTRIGIVSAVEVVEKQADHRVGTGSCRRVDNLIDLSGIKNHPEIVEQVREMLNKHSEVFDTSTLGCTPTLRHRLLTEDEVPVAQAYRRIPPQLWREVKDHIRDLLDRGIIQHSKSSYAAPIVIVRKSGSIRMCCDFRRLNRKIRRDVFPIPRVQESLDSMSGSTVFSIIDLASAYHQVEMEPEDRPKTAFTTPFGLFEWIRMPFGLANAPATFQRLMTTIFKDDVLEHLIVYLDDIIVFSVDLETHIKRLDAVLGKLAEHGLRVEPGKCNFFKKEVRFLGHIISAEGIRTEPDKIAAVAGWIRPSTLKELRRFLGFCSYYRRFVKGYANISAPLHKLVGELSSQKNGKFTKIGDLWKSEHEMAFSQLKSVLTSAPILGYADFSQPFILETDASHNGLGAVLSQRQNGVMRVIAYASRGLRKAERNANNYSSKKLELLALKWAIVDKFRDYLLGSTFEIFTDNNPMTYLLTKSKLPATEQKWASDLAGFDFAIHYRPGKHNLNADALSRQES